MEVVAETPTSVCGACNYQSIRCSACIHFFKGATNVDARDQYYVSLLRFVALKKGQEDSQHVSCRVADTWTSGGAQTTHSRIGLAILNGLFRRSRRSHPVLSFSVLRSPQSLAE